MRRAIEIIFMLSWLLCGCTVETVFDGGGMWFFVGVVVLIICAAVLGGTDD